MKEPYAGLNVSRAAAENVSASCPRLVMPESEGDRFSEGRSYGFTDVFLELLTNDHRVSCRMNRKWRVFSLLTARHSMERELHGGHRVGTDRESR